MGSEGVEEEEPKIGKTPGKKYQRHYFWCPVEDCPARPMQKMTQHLKKYHRMTIDTAAALYKRKRRALLEAARLKTPKTPIQEAAG